MPDTDTIDATDLPPIKAGAGGYGAGQPVPYPDPGTDTDAPGGVTSTSSLVGPRGSLTYEALRKSAADEATNRTYDLQSRRDRERMDAAFQRESSGPDSLPPKWDAATERQKTSTGPMEAFGSVGMIFALAASAFTKAPMTSALKAGGAVLEAIHAGDEERYKSAYQAWKDNTDLALKRFQMERDLFEDTNKLAATDAEQWRTKTAENAARFGDQKKLLMLEAGRDPEVLESDAAYIKSAELAMDYADKFQTHDAQMSILRAEDAAFREKNGIPPGKEGDKDLRLIHYKLGVLQSLHDPANSEQTLLMKNWRNEVISKEHRMPTSEEEVKKLQEIQQITSRSNEIDRRTRDYETDPSSPTFGDHASSYDRASKEVATAKQAGANLSPEAIDSAARIYVQTGKFPPNVGRGTQGAANVTAIQNRVAEIEKEQGKTPEQIAEGQRTFQTRTAGLRALETRRGRLLSSIYATDEMGDLLKQASDAAPRTKFTIINRGEQSIEASTSDPKLAAFTAAINSYVNTYAQALSPTGQSRISDKEHAYDLINKAMGTGAIDAVVDQLHKETRAEMSASRKALKELTTGEEPGLGVSSDGDTSKSTPAKSGVTPSGIKWSVEP